MKKSFKVTISILLCLSLLVPSLYVFAEDDNALKITVASDTHFQCAEDAGEFVIDPENTEYIEGLLNEKMFSNCTIQGQMNYESTAIVQKMLDEFSSSDDEYLLISGDLTCGKRQSHIEFAEMLKKAEEESGKKIFVVCGNHDCDDEDFEKYISIDEFKEIYADFGYNEALTKHETSGSYTYDLDDNYRLLAIDSCIYGADDGEINGSVYAWIEEQVEKAKEDSKTLVAMMHHSILPHFEIQPMIDGYENLASQFADWGINFVFTGHIHANDISMTVSDNGNVLYDIQTGALITYPNAYRRVVLNNGTVDISSQYITEIDTSLLPDGFSDEQLSLIESDFASYSYQFFEAGMCKWLNRYIGSAGKVGKLLKFEQGSAEYELLDDIMRNIGVSLSLPIYDDGSTPGVIDSIEEIAAAGGCTLPESDYERIYQVVAVIYGGFYHGDEDESVKENEYPLLYDCLKSVLAYTLAGVSFSSYALSDYGEMLEKAGYSKEFGNLVSDIAQVNFEKSEADILVSAILEKVTAGIIDDYSEPADINVTLDLNEFEKDADVSLNIFEKIFKIILGILEKFLPFVI